MDTRPEIPDPQHDRHVAFRDGPTGVTAGELVGADSPTGGAATAGAFASASIRTGSAAASARRLDGAARVVPLRQPHVTRDRHRDGRLRRSGPRRRLRAVVSGAGPHGNGGRTDGTIEPADASLYPIAPGTLWFRLEVVGNDPRGTVEVIGSHGSWVNAGEVALPYAVRLTRNNPDETLTITVNGAYGQRQVQCRVYLDDALVAIGTGEGTATCEVPGWR